MVIDIMMIHLRHFVVVGVVKKNKYDEDDIENNSDILCAFY